MYQHCIERTQLNRQPANKPETANAIRTKRVFGLLFTLVLATQVSMAQDWPQWRGPNRDGVVRNTLIISGLDKGTMAINVVKRAGRWDTEQLWRNADVSMYMNSPVVRGDYLFGLSHKRKGQFFCLDARTGQTAWTTVGREGDNAAIVAAGEFLFLLTDAAELIVAKNNAKQFEALKKYAVAESATWAHPVVLSNRIPIKDASTLALWSLE